MTDLTEAFKGAFQQPEIVETDYWEVETDAGTWFVPEDVVAMPKVRKLYSTEDADLNDAQLAEVEAVLEQLRDYVEGEPYSAEPKHGWLARLSAPGYLDCTEWTAHTTWDEAAESLVETYGY